MSRLLVNLLVMISLAWAGTALAAEPAPDGEKSAEFYVNQGVDHLQNGRYDQAIADYTKALEKDPRLVEAYTNRGLAHEAKGQLDQAIADYTKALGINPQEASAYVSRGYAYHAKGQYKRAIGDFTKAIAINPNYAQAYHGRGNAYAAGKDYDKALRDLNAAIKLDPKFELAHKDRDKVRGAKKDYDNQQRAAREAVEEEEPTPKAAPQAHNYNPSQGDVVAIRRVYASPSKVAPGQQVNLWVAYTILTLSNTPVSMTLTREVRYGGNLLGQPYQTTVSNYNGTFMDFAAYSVPSDAVIGTYTVTTRVISSYGTSQRDGYFVVLPPWVPGLLPPGVVPPPAPFPPGMAPPPGVY